MNGTLAFTSNVDVLSKSIQLEDGEHETNVLHASSIINIKPNDILALARAFLSISSMSHKKLQKLCYYAKAWYLALYGKNIINEQFEAWVHGAVQPTLYQYYKHYGFSDIPQISDISNIPEEFLSFAKEVYEAYGHLSGDDLERINHRESPWKEARGSLQPWEACSNTISEQTMMLYYRERLG